MHATENRERICQGGALASTCLGRRRHSELFSNSCTTKGLTGAALVLLYCCTLCSVCCEHVFPVHRPAHQRPHTQIETSHFELEAFGCIDSHPQPPWRQQRAIRLSDLLHQRSTDQTTSYGIVTLCSPVDADRQAACLDFRDPVSLTFQRWCSIGLPLGVFNFGPLTLALEVFTKATYSIGN